MRTRKTASIVSPTPSGNADYSEVKLENQATPAANVKTKIFAVHTLFNF